VQVRRFEQVVVGRVAAVGEATGKERATGEPATGKLAVLVVVASRRKD